ncbi:MAG TPA: hypothetical protein VOA64_04125 [Candidatus Dormibacteraeota bacterium]|nr:hypothetical protein [Candidatus Dormibacteraeota bacterium]
MDPLSLQVAEKNSQRRSQRVLLGIPVVVVMSGADKKPVSEETRTLVVNAHGALILLGLKVSIGQLLTLRNSITKEEQACRVAYVSPQSSDKKETGIEFMKPAPMFWRVAFPPPDWTPRSEDAKGPTPLRPAAKPDAQQKK